MPFRNAPEMRRARKIYQKAGVGTIKCTPWVVSYSERVWLIRVPGCVRSMS